MRVKTVSVSYERKINLGDFNSATVGMSAWADVDPEDDLSQVNNALFDMVKRNVKQQVLPLVDKAAKATAETVQFYAGLRVIDDTTGEVIENPSSCVYMYPNKKGKE